jgi:preprotein translocase subunit YajC
MKLSLAIFLATFCVSSFANNVKKIECFKSSYANTKPQEICTGDRVINSSRQEGIVTEVFDDGKVTFEYLEKNMFWKEQIKGLSKEVQSLEGLKVGDEVRNHYGFKAEIVKMYANGKTICIYDDRETAETGIEDLFDLIKI